MPATWKGHLTLGLVSIPVELYPAARKEGIRLHQLHKKCRTRLRRPLFCPTCNRQVDRSEVIKGYEYEKDRYVLVEEEEIRKIAPPTTRNLEIQEFVKLDEVDPLYFDASYLMVPDEGGSKPYKVFLEAMEETRRAAIGKVAMHHREYLVIIRSRDHGLTLNTMFFTDEIRQAPGYGQTNGIKVSAAEVKLAKQLIDSLSADFHPEKYHDEYQKRLRELLEAKQKGHRVTVEPQPQLAPVINMMEALKKSIAAQKTPARKTAATHVSSKRTRRKAS